jgi:hypothetical protein
MKDIMQKLAELEATAPKVTKKKMLNEDSTTPPMNVSSKPASLKDVFAALSENIIPGQKPLPVLDPQKKQAGMGFVTSDNPAVQNMLKNLDPKDVQIVQAPGQPGQAPAAGQPAPAGATGQPQAGQQQMREKKLDELSPELLNKAHSAAIAKGFAAQNKHRANHSEREWSKRMTPQEYMGPEGQRKHDQADKFLKAAKKKAADQKTNAETNSQLDEKFASQQQAKLMYATAGGADTGVSKKTAKEFIKKSHGQKVSKLPKKVKEGDIAPTSGQDTQGVNLGAGRSKIRLEGKKPDFLDLDKDGNKKEPMKKAAADKNKKKKVDESMNHRISAARLEGKSHGLRGHAHSGKRYEDLEEMKAYHEGYKDGMDELHEMGMYETAPAATVGGMASQAMPTMEDDVEEGNAFTAALAKTPKGGKFSVGGKTFTDRTSYDSNLGEYAFESLDNQLNALLTESEEVTEGLSVSISKGQQNSPDSVTITAQDAEAEHLLAFVKNAGLGLFGDDDADTHSSAMSIQPAHGAPDEVGAGGVDVEVVDGHDGMMGLMQKLSGIQSAGGDDYEDEEGDEEQLYGNHQAAGSKDCGCDGDCECSDYDQPSNEQACNECGGMMEAGHSCGSKMDEEQTPDQLEAEVAEDNAPDSDEAETSADEDAEAKEDSALAGAMSKDEEEVNESFASLLERLTKLSEGSGDEPKHNEHDKKDDKDQDDAEEEVTESDEEDEDAEDLTEWANQVGKGSGKGTDASFEQDIEFMTKVIAGGLNKPKSTGQTTIPVIAGQDDRMHDNPSDWAALAGIK